MSSLPELVLPCTQKQLLEGGALASTLALARSTVTPQRLSLKLTLKSKQAFTHADTTPLLTPAAPTQLGSSTLSSE